jgi:hypothetical protein
LNYERGILPGAGDGNDGHDPEGMFSADERLEFSRQAEELNRLCTGGRACFYLEKIE